MNKKNLLPISLLALIISGVGFIGYSSYNSQSVSANDVSSLSLKETLVEDSDTNNLDSNSSSPISVDESSDSTNDTSKLSDNEQGEQGEDIGMEAD